MMNKKEMLDILMLLSALESWSFAERRTIPDYLQERLCDVVGMLTFKIINEDDREDLCE